MPSSSRDYSPARNTQYIRCCSGRAEESTSAVAGGNRKGYAGYEFDPITSYSVWHVRNRVFNSDLGRWMRRDPVGYVETELYLYASSSPTGVSDPMGTHPALGGCIAGGIGGGVGGFLGGLVTGHPWCGALAGGFTGCCTGLLCTLAPTHCIMAGCICGAIGSGLGDLCERGWNVKALDWCTVANILIGAGIGCIGGASIEIESPDLAVLGAILGFDQAALMVLCPPTPGSGGSAPGSGPLAPTSASQPLRPPSGGSSGPPGSGPPSGYGLP